VRDGAPPVAGRAKAPRDSPCRGRSPGRSVEGHGSEDRQPTDRARAVKEHAAGWDITFSALKSVSVLWALSEPCERRRSSAPNARLLSRRRATWSRRQRGRDVARAALCVSRRSGCRWRHLITTRAASWTRSCTRRFRLQPCSAQGWHLGCASEPRTLSGAKARRCHTAWHSPANGSAPGIPSNMGPRIFTSRPYRVVSIASSQNGDRPSR
jgi:TrwC relaxase